MSVKITNGAVSLSTVNGFYAVEAYNLGQLGATVGFPKTVPVTFAAGGACQGIVIALHCGPNGTATSRPITVTLQELVGAVWTDRATVTYSAETISGNNPAQTVGTFQVPFTGGTFPYAVDALAGKWRFSISEGAGTANWSLATSDGTNPFFATWCDNAASFVDGDTLVAKDVLTIDQTANLGGVLPTGVTTYGTCLVICRSSNPTRDNVCLVRWQNPPAASYTLTFHGDVITGTNSGFQCGSSANRIPVAKRAIIDFGTPTVGTAVPRFICCYGPYATLGRLSLLLYGDYPTRRYTTLSGDATAGQKALTTVDATGWSPGDTIALGKAPRANADATVYTIDTIVGTAINVTVNLAKLHTAGGTVMTFSGYGIHLTATGATGSNYANIYVNGPLYVYVSGCYINRCTFEMLINSWWYASCTDANADTATLQYNAVDNSVGGYYLLRSLALTPAGVTIADNGLHGTSPMGSCATMLTSGRITVANNRILNLGQPGPMLASGLNWQMSFYGNSVETSSYNYPLVKIDGVSVDFYDNYFWACGTTQYGEAVGIYTLINPRRVGGNSYQNCMWAVRFYSFATIGVVDVDSQFGNLTANNTDVVVSSGAYVDYAFQSPSGMAANDLTTRQYWLPGSNLRITDFNDSVGDDRGYLPLGFFQRAGAGLLDTTCHTAGGFALRFKPSSSTDNLSWSFTIPTGNIAAKTMYVSVWVKINSATFYAGTHQKPRLSILYDNLTTVYVEAAASTAWQLLTMPFTPATAYGQITVTLSCRTDATGTDAYVYWDDMSVAYPPNVALDLGGFDLWANALPVTPPLAIPLSAQTVAGAVWDAQRSGHATAGSFGAVSEWTGGLDAAGVRAALGMAGANLDTQLGDLPTNAELSAALAASDDATLAAIGALANLDAAGAEAAAAAALTAYSAATAGDVDAAETAILAAIAGIVGITADDVLDEDVEGALTLRQAVRVLIAFAAGLASGGGTTTIVYRDQADTRDRIQLTVDSSGNRTGSVLDVTP